MTRIFMIILLILVPLESEASDSSFAEFDSGFLSAPVDVDLFSYGNPINQGKYELPIYLNTHYLATQTIYIEHNSPNSNVSEQLCVTLELLSLFDLITPPSLTSECGRLTVLVEGSSAEVDLNKLKLSIEIPQAYLHSRPKDYIPTSQWDSGVTAGNNQSGKYTVNRTYAEHDVTLLKSRFTIGDFYTTNNLMDGISLRGVQLASGNQMLTRSERDFVPEIRGIANSNARIQVSQSGNVIYETTVPPGPFNLTNLPYPPYNSNLNVSVLEADGTVQKFTIPYSSSQT